MLSVVTVPQTAAALGALDERTTSNGHLFVVSAGAQLALPLYNQRNLNAAVKMKMIHDLCLLLVNYLC